MRIRRLLSPRRDLVVMIALPLLVRGLSFVADELRDRHRDSRIADGLDQAHRVLRKIQRFV